MCVYEGVGPMVMLDHPMSYKHANKNTYIHFSAWVIHDGL